MSFHIGINCFINIHFDTIIDINITKVKLDLKIWLLNVTTRKRIIIEHRVSSINTMNEVVSFSVLLVRFNCLSPLSSTLLEYNLFYWSHQFDRSEQNILSDWTVCLGFWLNLKFIRIPPSSQDCRLYFPLTLNSFLIPHSVCWFSSQPGNQFCRIVASVSSQLSCSLQFM